MVAPAIRAGTARQARKAACTSEFDAALILHERSEELKHKVRLDKSVADDQLVQAAAARPRKYRARYLSAQFQGPTARKDAEDSERNRWTTELADLLRGTQSPMGQFLASQPGNQLTEADDGQARCGPESEVSSASSPGWLCVMSSPTRQSLVSSQSTFRCVCRSRATEALSKDHITRWCSSSPWLESRHKTASLTVSCITSCTRNSWWQLCLAAPSKASAQSPHSHARGT